jgi:alkanesulfonate monooxygenase SsuD/methylene tetrahydromethanopterin reductase-like flavin-dependent oxidoreductase (luciferase family)
MKIGTFSLARSGPRDLVAQAVKAQRAGFEGLWISDHYHPPGRSSWMSTRCALLS